MTNPPSSAPDTNGDSAAKKPDSTGVPWWRRAITYQVYIRSFADGNGDGTGDVNGLRSRLPYLRDLGVDAIWINPWYASPLADGGYDVADYRNIAESYGTLADAEALISEAHDHGINVIVDVVPNHTSEEHAWFVEAKAAPSGDSSRARYHIRPGRGPNGDEPPTNWMSVFGGPAWSRLPDGEWYLHLFAPEQPDMNWENPEVRQEFIDVLRFWLDRGANGFRSTWHEDNSFSFPAGVFLRGFLLFFLGIYGLHFYLTLLAISFNPIHSSTILKQQDYFQHFPLLYDFPWLAEILRKPFAY